MLFRKPLAPAEPANLPTVSNHANLFAKAIAHAHGKSLVEAINGDGVVLIGKGTRMTSSIRDCTVLEIQGVLEGDVIADKVIVLDGGGFKGNMKTDHLEVRGEVEGNINVKGVLDIRSTGRVTAAVSYGQLSVETGGALSGDIQAQKTIELESERVDPMARLVSVNGMHKGNANGSAPS